MEAAHTYNSLIPTAMLNSLVDAHGHTCLTEKVNIATLLL